MTLLGRFARTSALAVTLSMCMAVAGPAASAQSSTAAAPARFVVGTGDILRVSVFQNADLQTEQRVDEQGRISFPFLGLVEVGDLATSEIEKKIALGLEQREVIKHPQVIVNVVQYRSRQISVLGNVNRPGRYPLDVPLTVSDALAQAGGVSMPGGADAVTLSRIENGTPVSVEIDVPTLFAPGPGRTQDVPLRSGDVLYVARAPVFYIYGEVQRPGMYRLERGMTVMQALSAGGGLTARGTERSVKVTRSQGDGSPKSSSVPLDDRVRPDDVIYVHEALF